MAKTENKTENKTTKKGRRRLKRSVRKTLGALFLVSAIVVAAIPVDGLQAWSGSETATNPPQKIWVADKEDTTNAGYGIIPVITPGTEVYYSANGAFTFALNFGTTGTGNYPAGLIALEYDSLYNLEAVTGGTLTIDNTYDVYAPYGNGSRCAVCAEGPVYYLEREQYYKPTPGVGGTNQNMYGYVVMTKNGGYAEKPEGASNEWGTEETIGGQKQWIYYSIYANLTTLKYENHEKDVSGNEIQIEEIEYNLQPYIVEKYKPCLSGEIEKWKPMEEKGLQTNENGTVYWAGLYYLESGTEGESSAVYGRVDGDIKRFKDIPLTYIGNQEIELDTTTNRYKVSDKFITTAGKGIFSSDKLTGGGSSTSITAVRFGSSLLGIGDYAFYGSSINSVEFSGGMNVIGDYAFANCGNLRKVTLTNHGLRIIGAHAFENCTLLPEFTAPDTLEAIGDAAFKGCTTLTKIDFGTQLKQLGYYAFENCEKLESLTFPDSLTETVPISTIRGCVNLKYVKHLSTSTTQTFTFVNNDKTVFTNDEYELENFRKELLANSNENFYFEGYQGKDAVITPLHQMARDNLFAFKYLNENRYEITTTSQNADGSEHRATYQAMYNGGTVPDTLLSVEIDDGMENVTIPGAIGPCRVTVIGSTSFQNNCNLVSVTIPGSITEIESEAFKGCHNLKTVTFAYKDDELAKLTIGANAFATQDVSTNNHEEHEGTVYVPDPTPQLFFEGPISVNFDAFKYAMNPNNNINYGSQNGPTYITYFSGWPSNLVVRYNGSTKKQELIAYPTLYNVYKDDTGLLDNKNQPIKWTDLNYVKWGDDYKSAFGNGITSAFLSYINDGSLSGNQRDLITAMLNIELPEGIQSVAWFNNSSGSSVSVGDSSSDHVKSTVIGIEDAEKVSLFTLNAANEKKAPIEFSAIKGTKTITTNGLEILDRTFEDCDTLKTAYIQGNTTAMGDYAFMGCSELTGVEIPIAMKSMGKRPFTGCENLTTVSCPSSPYFTCKNSILFGPATNGTITKVIECLEGRKSGSVSAEDLSGATEMAVEAFAGTEVYSVSLRDTMIENIPPSAFQYTKTLFTVELPYSLMQIQDNAFSDCGIKDLYFIGGNNLAMVSSSAFGDTEHDKYKDLTDLSTLTIWCPENSTAHKIAVTLVGEDQVKNIEEVVYYTVEFYDSEDNGGALLHTEGNVLGGTSVDVDKLIQEGKIKVEQRPGYMITWFPQNFNPVKSGESNPVKTYLRYEVDEGVKYTVKFVDDDMKVVDTQEVSPSGKVYPPYMEAKNGVAFSGWICVGGDYNIKDLQISAASLTSDVMFMAQYGDAEGFLVSFLDWDGTVLYAKAVPAGGSLEYPTDKLGIPRRADYIFRSWSGDTTNITKDTTVFAIYDPDPSSGNSGNGSGGNGSSGNGSGGNGTVSGNGKYYTLTVRNGSGSGSYVAGSQAIIVANDPAAGMEFSNWTIEPTNTTIASTGISATVITMPETNVTVVANYRTKSGTSSGSGTTGSSNSSNRPGTTGTLNNGGTTVVINKNGLSNTGVVSATVNGSSDNFTIKISESQTASESVVRALMAEYNNNLSSIKYFPMDISLYDSTGQKKITDTTGLKITITLPLPDSLKEYAGNNKVAGVVNDRLDKLTPRFTTISGVPCITFTAEHFSPYVIYVDTTNLSANGMADSTPKTGDGIHPKWFLSMGLGCLSIVFFMKKDKKKEKRPVKVKA